MEKDVVGPSSMVVESDSVGPSPWLHQIKSNQNIIALVLQDDNRKRSENENNIYESSELMI